MATINSRCAGEGRHGRCQLRGSIGSTDADGGRWYCPWHDHALSKRLTPSLEEFTVFVKEQMFHGSERWRKRPIDEWWALAQGLSGPGGYDHWRLGQLENKVEEERPDSTEDRYK